MMAIFLPIFVIAVSTVYASESVHEAKVPSKKAPHKHSQDEEHQKEDKHSDHGKDEKDSGHAHEGEEENPGVGLEKGIVEANDKDGFKLSAEAFKNFDLTFANVVGAGPTSLPQAAIVFAGEETNLFRMRDNFFKRIDFKVLQKLKNEVVVTSSDLAPGDKIAITGIGFLRIAELAAFGGVADSHSH